MSIPAELGPSSVAVAPPQRKIGRWLAWLAYLLIGLGGWSSVAFVHNMAEINTGTEADPFLSLMRIFGLDLLARLCLPVAGLVLLFWRKPAGLYVAFTLIWLGPVTQICSLLLRHKPDPEIDIAAVQLFFTLLRGHVFAACGCSAFLLGVPAIQRAYGLVPAPLMPAGVSSEAAGTTIFRQASWLSLLCLFLLLPLLSLLPSFAPFTSSSTYWDQRETMRQIICLAFTLPAGLAAIVTLKYRRRSSISLVIAALWLTVVVMFGHAIDPQDIRSMTPGMPWLAHAWYYGSDLPFLFGIEPIGTFAWTAYLLNAPRVQEMYPAPVEEIDVESF
jgi:hypothetical protein